MDIGLTALWILVGWCGTPPRPWPWPPGKPTPDPWITKTIGVIGGLAGGFLYQSVFGHSTVEGMSAINAAASAVGAFTGAYFLGDMYNLAKGAGQKQ